MARDSPAAAVTLPGLQTSPSHAPPKKGLWIPSGLGSCVSAPALLGGPGGQDDTIPRGKLPALDCGNGRRGAAAGGRGCVSMGALPQLPGGPENSSSSSSRRPKMQLMLSQDELRQLPVVEAVRQVLIQRSGSLRQAYSALDVRRTGKVSRMDFEKGLSALNIYSSPLEDFATIQSLFEELSRGSDELALHYLLGYVPIDRKGRAQDGHGTCGETHTKWFEYHNKTSAMKSRLVRQPAWHPTSRKAKENLPPIGGDQERSNRDVSLDSKPQTWDEAESIRRRRRQDLRRQFREARVKMEGDEKRELVGGLVPPEDAPDHWEREHIRVMRHRSRIEGAIRDCSRARGQLVEMQKMLSQVSDAGKFSMDDDMKANLKMALLGELPKHGQSGSQAPAPLTFEQQILCCQDLSVEKTMRPERTLKARIAPES